jgi:hypothetical protein
MLREAGNIRSARRSIRDIYKPVFHWCTRKTQSSAPNLREVDSTYNRMPPFPFDIQYDFPLHYYFVSQMVSSVCVSKQNFVCTYNCHDCYVWRILNVAIKYAKLLLHISLILGSNLGAENGYPDYGFPWFPSAPLSKFRNRTAIRPWPLPSKFSSIHYSPILPFNFINTGLPWYTDTALKIKP